jgi:hypothetical protein
MPIWTRNKITVTGDKEDLNIINDAQFSFHVFRPCPCYEEDDSDSWCCNNWGTKWDVLNPDGEPDDNWGYHSVNYDEAFGVLHANLLTHNNPPIELLRYVSEKMPTLNINLMYYTDDNNECGEVVFKKGTFDTIIPNDPVTFREQMDTIHFRGRT